MTIKQRRDILSDLKNLGFVDVKDRIVYPRLIVSISGLEKQGKTTFALTAPGPIAVLSTDAGEEGVVNKFPDKKIYIMDVVTVKEEVGKEAEDEAVEEWGKFQKAYNGCLRSKEIRTIVFDTASEIWELLRMARFGKLAQIRPIHYGPVNREYRTLIREAMNWDKNLILLHKMKAQWVNDKRTGEWERAGFSDTGFLVQINARVYRYAPEDGGEFAIYIDDCRQNADLAGEEFVGEMCNFPFLAMNVLPDVDPSLWL